MRIRSSINTGRHYWYFTTHGVMPGSVPKGVNILEIKDTSNGSYFLADKLLTTQELKYYDIKERCPESVKCSSVKRKLDRRDKVYAYNYTYDGDALDNLLEDVKIHIKIDQEILFDRSMKYYDYIYVDDSYNWASEDGRGSDWEDRFYNKIEDKTSMVERLDELLMDNIWDVLDNASDGDRFRLIADVTLYYEPDVNYYGSVTYFLDNSKCKIHNFEMPKIN